MAQPPPVADVQAHIEGEISGQIAVGNNNLQIGSVVGGVVNIATPEQRPRPRPRPTPVFLGPHRPPALLDRTGEIHAANAALQAALPVEFYSQEGVGKTTLLHYLVHQPPDGSFPDGIIYHRARHWVVDDLLQFFFDAFYESDFPFKPTDAEIRHALQNKQALILLDDVELARDDVEALMDAVPGCTFLLASPERRLWREGLAMVLQGLPPKDALALIERELRRSLTPAERPTAQSLCTALEGHPLRILQAIAMAQEEGHSLAEIAQRVESVPSVELLTAPALKSLPQAERRVLAALAVLGGVSLPAEHLAALTGLPNTVSVLETLLRRRLIQAHSPRYSLTGNLGQTLQQAWDLTSWAERALAFFTDWAERHQSAPERLIEEAEAILRTLEWATRTGRWKDVLRLGGAVEGALALGRRWGAWAQVLRWMLDAARALGNQPAQAWAHHQLGTRALCLGDTSTARPALTQALRLRESLGDQIGAAATSHNLSLLLDLPNGRWTPNGPSLFKGLIAFLIVVGLALGGLAIWRPWSRPTVSPSPIRAVITSTPTRTAAPTPTNTPTRTLTPTYTSTRTLTNTPTSTPTRTPTNTPTPSKTPTSTSTSTPTPCIPAASFVGDVTVPDNTQFLAGQAFEKVWRIRNSGGCIWGEGVRWVFVSGEKMGAPDSVPAADTLPGASVDISVSMVAPAVPGTYKGIWRLQSASGRSLSGDVWVQIVVPEPTPTSTPTHTPTFTHTPSPTFTPTPTPGPVTLYDFVARADQARWHSVAGDLPFPGQVNDSRGFALWQENATLEDGSRPQRVLETHPRWVTDGSIWGRYRDTDQIVIQKGDRFVADVGFLQGAGAGSVTFEVTFWPPGEEFPPPLGTLDDTYDGRLRHWEIPLDEYAGVKGAFTLAVYAGESSGQDWAVWVDARLVRP